MAPASEVLFAEFSPLLSDAHATLVPRVLNFSDPEHFTKIKPIQLHYATAYLIITPITQILCLLVFIARVYTRSRPTWRFGLSDYLVSVAFVRLLSVSSVSASQMSFGPGINAADLSKCLMTVEWALQFESITWAFRPPDKRVYLTMDRLQQSAMEGTIALPFWAWSTGLIKISIAVMLLKFQQSKRWRAFVYLMILANVFFICFIGIAHIFSCTPQIARWDVTGKYAKVKKCWPMGARRATIYASVAVNVSSDVVFSLVPLTFLRKVRRPRREKIVIGSLLALGIFASAFAIARLIEQSVTSITGDNGADSTFSGLMTILETHSSFLAACIPMLRSSANRWLQRLGIWTGTTSRSRYQRYGSDREYDVTGATDPLELGRVGGKGGISVTKNVSVQNTESEDESGNFVMDPVTGRIVRTMSGNDEWGGATRSLDDEWKLHTSAAQIR